MRKTLLAACAAALFAASAHADLVASQGAENVRLFEAPCKNEKILGFIDPRLEPAQYGAAVAVLGGTTYQACYRILDNQVHLVYEDGDQGLVPIKQFKADLSKV